MPGNLQRSYVRSDELPPCGTFGDVERPWKMESHESPLWCLLVEARSLYLQCMTLHDSPDPPDQPPVPGDVRGPVASGHCSSWARASEYQPNSRPSTNNA